MDWSKKKVKAELYKRLRQHCIGELRRRTENEPQPPADWSRAAKIDCNCDDCKLLKRFLRSKTETTLKLPRRASLREHLQDEIDNNRLDCTYTTERVGSPHRLVCKKTQATFDRDLRQYQTDLKLLAELQS